MYVQTYIDGQLINTETFDIDQESFTYEYEPTGNKSKINFKLVDKYNNIKNQEVLISHTPISQDLADLLKGVSSFNSKEFAELLSSPTIQQAKTIKELINILYDEGAKVGLNQNQIDALIIALAISSGTPTPEFISKLQILATGKLKQTLDTVLINQKDFTTNLSVVKYLSEKAKQNGYTDEDITKLLKEFISQSNLDPKKAIALLNKIIGIDISEILANLDARAIDIVTIQDFIKYFEKRNFYSKEETEFIYALLEGIYITTEKTQPIVKPEEEISISEASKEKSNILLFFIILCFAGLGIIFIVFTRRRKSKKRNEKKFKI